MTYLVDVLFFDMNSYFASVAQQEEPKLIGRPVGVLTTDAPGAACIAASTEAKRCGVRMGTRQAEARVLCPDIVFRPARHDVCVRYHHAIRAAAEEILPIEAAHSVDEFSCQLRGPQRELAQALEIAQQLQTNILHRVGPAMRSSVGVAPSRLLAKIAAELQKPMGINWLHPAVLPEKIGHLQLSDLPGISKGMQPRLQAAGIATVADLYALPPKHARAIWGNVNGERFLRELRGEQVVWPRAQGHSLGHGQVLSGANATRLGARLVARRLLVKAAARLRRTGDFCAGLSLGVRMHSGARFGRKARFPSTQDSLVLLGHLDGMWQDLPWSRAGLQPVRSVSVTLVERASAAQHTADLFEGRQGPGKRTPREDLCHMIDRLNQKYGRDTIRFGELPPFHVPYTGAKIAFGRVPDPEDFHE